MQIDAIVFNDAKEVAVIPKISFSFSEFTIMDCYPQFKHLSKT